jgi:hypothetical protein
MFNNRGMEDSTNSQSVLDEVRRRIDAHHAEALRALDTVRAYLDENPGDFPPPSAEVASQSLPETPPVHFVFQHHGSKRDRVCAVIAEQPASVKEISEATDLTEKEVRGVLYAKDVAPRLIQGKNKAGYKTFVLKPDG